MILATSGKSMVPSMACCEQPTLLGKRWWNIFFSLDFDIMELLTYCKRRKKDDNFLNGRRSIFKLLLKPSIKDCFPVAEMSFAKRGKSSKAKVPKAQLAARANWRSPSTPQFVEIPSGDSMNHTAFRNKTCMVILSWNFCQPEAESWFGLIWKQNATRMSETCKCFRCLFNCSSLTQVHHKNCMASPSRVLTAAPSNQWHVIP